MTIMAMSEQEQQAIEKAGKEYVYKVPPTIRVVSYDSELYDKVVRDAFLAGAKALDETRKPTDRPNIKDYFETDAPLDSVHNEITLAPHLFAYAKALDAHIDGLSIGKPDGDLVKRIEEIIQKSDGNLHWLTYNKISTEIAALIQSDTWPPQPKGTTYATNSANGKPFYMQQNDFQLLSALKALIYLKDWKELHGKDEFYLKNQSDVWKKARQAISNYEKHE